MHHEIKGTILIIDDTPVNLKLLSELLAKRGYLTHIAPNGRDGLRMVADIQPDLVLLDIKMPEMDGYEVCMHLKEDDETRDIPVIFISALNDAEDIVKGFEVGGVDYVTKPFKFPEVLARVENHLTLLHQRRQLEDIRERDRQYYQKLTHMKDQFIGAATHDLKNPLALIIGYLGLLEDQPQIQADETSMMYIEGIMQGTKKITRLVTEMLDLLQIESGIILNVREVNVRPFLQGRKQEFERLAEQKHIQLQLTVEDSTLLGIFDPDRFERVMDNLISNAIKYTPEGGEVNIFAQRHEDLLVFQVQDTGMGIPEDALPYLFDAFYRVNESAHREIEGTGLGLSVARSIVEQHGGTIYVDTALEQGSMFTVTLPVKPGLNSQ